MADVNRGNRPLSPHLSIYRPQLTSMTSIFTRLTGNALIVGALLIVWWFAALKRHFAHMLATLDGGQSTNEKMQPAGESEPHLVVSSVRRNGDVINVTFLPGVNLAPRYLHTGQSQPENPHRKDAPTAS